MALDTIVQQIWQAASLPWNHLPRLRLCPGLLICPVVRTTDRGKSIQRVLSRRIRLGRGHYY